MPTFSPRAWREAMNLTQRQAAQALDITHKAWQEMERGTRFGTELPAVPDKRTQLACAWLLAAEMGRLDARTVAMVQRRMYPETLNETT